MCIVCGSDSGKTYCSKKCYDKEYREKNRAKRIKQGREYYKKNKEEILRKSKEYVEKNKEKVLEYRKSWRESTKSRKREKDRARYNENRTYILECQKKRRESDPILYKINNCVFHQLGTIKDITIEEKKAVFVSTQFNRQQKENRDSIREVLRYE